MLQKLQELLMFKNIKTGKPSYTTTAFIVGFFVVNMKLIFAGVSVGDKFKSSDFSGTDYAAAVAALGGIYLLNKHNNKPSDDSKEK